MKQRAMAMPTKAIWMGSYLPATLRTITEETDQKVTEQMEAAMPAKLSSPPPTPRMA